MSKHHASVAVLFITIMAFGSGCTYMKQRGRDATNMFDLGITVNKTWAPQFSFYFDFFNVTPIGWGKLDAKVLGMGHRQIGWMDYEADVSGYMAWGSEKHGYGVFNPNDPQQAWPEQKDLTERPRYDVGFIGSFEGENLAPNMQFAECNRIFHFGWIGIQNTMRPAGILDFIVGWSGYDLLGDNNLPAPPTPVSES